MATTKFKEYTPIVHIFLSNLVKTEILWWRNWLKVDFSGAFPPVLHSKLTSLKIFYSEQKNIRTSKNVRRFTTKFLIENHPQFWKRKSNISDRTLHSLPWCFFVSNFHLLSRAKNWSLKRNRLGEICQVRISFTRKKFPDWNGDWR